MQKRRVRRKKKVQAISQKHPSKVAAFWVKLCASGQNGFYASLQEFYFLCQEQILMGGNFSATVHRRENTKVLCHCALRRFKICPTALAKTPDTPDCLLPPQAAAQMEKFWTSLGSDVPRTNLLIAHFHVSYLNMLKESETQHVSPCFNGTGRK